MNNTSKIVVIGDIHGDINQLNKVAAALTYGDYLIILGDFGLVWKDVEGSLTSLRAVTRDNQCTIAFLDGNHEDFSLLKSLEQLDSWKGGKVGVLPYGILHLMRGEIYNINDGYIGVCGGADSVDKQYREENVSWWAEETITSMDIANLKSNFEKKRQIDVMLTHDCPASCASYLRVFSQFKDKSFSTSQMRLEEALYATNPTKWYFGHWHLDLAISDTFTCVYRNAIEI